MVRVVPRAGRGDDPSRTADPNLHATVEGGGSAFVQLNRGKKSVALNPTTAAGKEVCCEMAPHTAAPARAEDREGEVWSEVSLPAASH